MLNIFSMLDELNHKKLILFLEREKDSKKVSQLLNMKMDGCMKIPLIGKVENINTIQYLMAKIIIEEANFTISRNNNQISSKNNQNDVCDFLDLRDEYWRTLLIVMKKVDLDIINNEDSNGNNCLHYCAVFGDYDLTKMILEKGISVVKNKRNAYAYHLCTDERTKKLLRNWTKFNSNDELFINYDDTFIEKDETIFDYNQFSYNEVGMNGKKQNDFNNFEEDICEQNASSKKECIEETLKNELVSDENNQNDDLSKKGSFIDEKSVGVNFDSGKINDSPLDKYSINSPLNNNSFDEATSILDKTPISNHKINASNNTNNRDLYLYKDLQGESSSLSSKKEIIIREEKIDLVSEIREIKKYPGKLYLYLGNIVGYFSERKDVVGIGFRIFYEKKIYETKLYNPNSSIEIDKLFSFNLSSADSKIKIFMVARFSDKPETDNKIYKKSSIRKILATSLNLNAEVINRIHNNLLQRDLHWKKYKTKNWIKSFKDLFSNKLPSASLLTCYISYIADDEFKYVNAAPPDDINTLSYWLRYRKNSFNKWFTGYVNIRGDNSCVATHLWKRRFIQWNGYIIMVYNESSGKFMGQIDLTNAQYSICARDGKNTFVPNAFTTVFKDSSIEFQFDNKEKHEIGLDALGHLLNH